MRKYLIVFTIASTILSVGCASKPKTDEVAASTNPHHYVGDTDFHPKAKDPANVTSHPKVCFDEAHHNLAVQKGFYQAIQELVQSDGYELVRLQKEVTPKFLRQCKVFYTSASLGFADVSDRKKAARSSFDDNEIHAIVSWVFQGGALLVMTDHQPMSQAAQRLLGQFKIKGSLINVRNEQKPLANFPDPGIFTIDESMMDSKHPIIQGRNDSERLKKVFWFYGQALQGPKNSESFLKTGNGALIGGENGESAIAAEQFPAAALALKYKKGRVVVFGDATVFTSKKDLKMNITTGINHPGSDNVQMALNVFHWLSGILP